MLAFLNRELKELQRQGLLRRFKTISARDGARVKIDGRWYLSFCSNDYLGLAQHPATRRAMIEATRRFGTGAGASRLMAGTLTPHEELEHALARFKHQPEAVLFTSGYAANLGVITTLVRPNDTIFSDQLNHASLVDAARLTKARLYIYRHRDMGHLEQLLKSTLHTTRYSLRYIITDAIFSMDGDAAPLREIVRLARKYQAYTVVDEAHGTGVLGKHGRGLSEHLGLEDKIDLIIGTLSKALGSSGGFVTGSKDLILYLRSKSRPFIYTTALPPAVCAASLTALRLLKEKPELRRRLWVNTNYLKDRLRKMGFDLRDSETPIMPIMIGNEKKALKIAHHLWNKGLFIPAIRPPTVPKGESRLRITVTAMHTRGDLDRLLDGLNSLQTGLIS